jgi:predicted small lipoprotein YifL
MRPVIFGTILLLSVGSLAACGNQGPPIPPENVGIRAKMLREQERDRAAAAQPGSTSGPPPTVTAGPSAGQAQEEFSLPPYRPVGTR